MDLYNKEVSQLKANAIKYQSQIIYLSKSNGCCIFCSQTGNIQGRRIRCNTGSGHRYNNFDNHMNLQI